VRGKTTPGSHGWILAVRARDAVEEDVTAATAVPEEEFYAEQEGSYDSEENDPRSAPPTPPGNSTSR
jgi:hypothetical protein